MTTTSEILKKVRKIEIKTKELSKHLFSGEYSSTFKGRGMSFSEVRDYQYGDDIRNIDWNVTARTNSPHVKVYEEERELTVIFLVDVSRSSFFGTMNQFKSEINTEICATLGFSALTNHDKVGAILFTDQVEAYIPPKKGKNHILRIIRELIYFQPKSKGTDLAAALKYLNSVVKKKSIAFVMSDFMTADYDTELKIAARRHDLIGVRVYDDLEARLPNVGLVKIMDAESGEEHLIDTGSRKIREKYANHFTERSDYFFNSFKRSGANIITLNTKEDYVKGLIRFFKSRHKK
ncbi:MAG: hypothetical protein ACI9FN_001264 [Saprospiraceae bacterium]|jgi:uncharacterized protein (DUF58 family)